MGGLSARCRCGASPARTQHAWLFAPGRWPWPAGRGAAGPGPPKQSRSPEAAAPAGPPLQQPLGAEQPPHRPGTRPQACWRWPAAAGRAGWRPRHCSWGRKHCRRPTGPTAARRHPGSTRGGQQACNGAGDAGCTAELRRASVLVCRGTSLRAGCRARPGGVPPPGQQPLSASPWAGGATSTGPAKRGWFSAACPRGSGPG